MACRLPLGDGAVDTLPCRFDAVRPPKRPRCRAGPPPPRMRYTRIKRSDVAGVDAGGVPLRALLRLQPRQRPPVPGFGCRAAPASGPGCRVHSSFRRSIPASGRCLPRACTPCSCDGAVGARHASGPLIGRSPCTRATATAARARCTARTTSTTTPHISTTIRADRRGVGEPFHEIGVG